MNGFKHSDPELTKSVQGLYRDCPLLFQSLLPRSEFEVLAVSDPDALEDETSVVLKADNEHLRPSAIGCLQQKYAREVLAFPVREKQMDAIFKTELTRAFDRDYSSPNVLHFGKIPLQWTKKLSFTDKLVTYFAYL